MKICCFTGHRVLSKAETALLISRLDEKLEALYRAGFSEFRTGGARGFDTLAALRVLALCERHPACSLVLMLPCRDQTKLWREGEKALFEEIRAKAAKVKYMADSYTPTCMYARNRALVDGSDLCIAYLKENRGGTLYTCSYALKNGVELLNLYDEEA